MTKAGGKQGRLVCAALALIATGISLLITPPARASGAAYGPLTICIGGYAARIEALEGAVLFDEPDQPTRLVILSDRAPMLTVQLGPPVPDGRTWTTEKVTVPRLGAATRYRYPRQFVPRGGIPGEALIIEESAHSEYELPAAGGRYGVMVISAAFKGKGDDLTALQRFVIRSDRTDCAQLESDSQGVTMGEVHVYSARRISGPAFACMGGVGLLLRDGETVLHSWRSEIGRRNRLINSDGYSIDIGEIEIGETNFGRRGSLLSMGYRIERQANGYGAFFIPSEEWQGGRIVSVNAKGLDREGLADLLGRLEFVRRNDRRCRQR